MAKAERRPARATRVAAIAPVDQEYVSRRVRRHLNDLERTNYTEATSGPTTYGENDERDDAPSALGKNEDDSTAFGRKKKKSTPAVRQLLMYRKSLATLLAESNLASLSNSTPNYLTAAASPSLLPPLQLCSVCGYKGRYGCLRCGLKYCDRGCQAVHDESRCERR